VGVVGVAGVLGDIAYVIGNISRNCPSRRVVVDL
jgi:hypothetical protein